VLKNPLELHQALQFLLQDMHLDPALQFRLIGVGVYQLSPRQQEAQLTLL